MEKNNTKTNKVWIILSAILAVALVFMTCLYFFVPMSKNALNSSSEGVKAIS